MWPVSSRRSPRPRQSSSHRRTSASCCSDASRSLPCTPCVCSCRGRLDQHGDHRSACATSLVACFSQCAAAGCGSNGTSSRFKSSLPGRSRPNSMCRRVWVSFPYLYHILFPIQFLLSARSSAVRVLSLSLDVYCEATRVWSWCLRNRASTWGMAGFDLLFAVMPLMCFLSCCLRTLPFGRTACGLCVSLELHHRRRCAEGPRRLFA